MRIVLIFAQFVFVSQINAGILNNEIRIPTIIVASIFDENRNDFSFRERREELGENFKKLVTSIVKKIFPDDLRILPWQTSLLLRIFRPELAGMEIPDGLVDTNRLVATPREKWLSSRGHRWVQGWVTWIEGFVTEMSKWVSHHQKSFEIGCKATLITIVGKYNDN